MVEVEGFYPTRLIEALSVLKGKEDTMLIAGGTDLMVVGKKASNMIFLNSLPELSVITEDTDTLTIGPCCTYEMLLRDQRIPELLKKAIAGIAAPAIRNAGTLGGNICNASPAGDTLPVLYVLEAAVVMASLGKNEEIVVRKLPISEFILGIRKISLKPNEIVTGIELPKNIYENATKLYYQKVGARNAQAISKLSFAAIMRIEEERITDIKMAFGSVGTTVVRRPELERKIIGLSSNELKDERERIRVAYADFLHPISDQRSTAQYRKKVCLNLLWDFLQL